jgi:hypothetical protein
MSFVLFRRGIASLMVGLAALTVAAPTAVAGTHVANRYGVAAQPTLSLVTLPATSGPSKSTPAQATNTVWSGSVVDTTSTSVHALWTEPQVKCGTAATYGAIWVGIDGDGSQTVEQTGTQESCRGGHLSVDGWYEMYPKPAVALPAGHTVEPGNVMRATVAYHGAGTFSLTLRNVSRGWTATELLSAPTAARVSAEVVIETPSSETPNLNHFGTVTFTGVTINNRSLSHWDSSMTRYNLVTDNGTVEDTTSAPTAASFSVKSDS